MGWGCPFTTRKLEEEVRNPELKLQQSTNIEAGMDFDIDNVAERSFSLRNI